MSTSISRYQFDAGSNKQVLIEALLRKQGLASPSSRAGIPRRKTRAQAPLSFAQQRLWFLEQMAPGSAVYNVSLALRLGGRLDPDLMARSINEIMRRHESLRTTFRADNGEPVQLTGEFRECRLPVVQLDALPPAERAQRIESHIAEEATRAFDLERGPLVRNTLLRISADEHIWLLTMHHLVCDGWSMEVFFREFKAIYEAYARGADAPLAELLVQYADFAAWQRESLSGEKMDALLKWWHQQLAGAQPVSTLPADRPRPAVQGFEGGNHPVVLPRDLSQRLRELCRQEQATLFMSLLAASHALLYRYTGQEDLVTGTMVANRDRDETRGLIGLLVNAVPLRIRASGDTTFRELLRSARETVMGAFAHQDLPFEKLVDAVGMERTLSHTPLFQVAVTLQHAGLERMELPGITAAPLAAEHPPAKYDLTISFTDREEISGVFEYSAGLFDEPTIARAAAHFRRLIEAFVQNPDVRLADAAMLSPMEERQILVEWNQTAAPYPEDRCLHHLFEDHVDRAPAAAAVRFEGQSISYGELEARANRIARYLRRLGVTRETHTAIFFRERSIDMVTAMLAVLKAGGAYVPFDPTHPRERLRFQMEDAGVRVVLTDSESLPNLPELPVQAVCLDRQMSEIEDMPDTRLPESPDPASIAYIIYTSGSTGKPKGVLIRHAGACNLVTTSANAFQVGPGSRFLQFASATFDASVLEIFTTLSAGAELCLARRQTIRSATDLARLMRDQQISAAILPPTMLRIMPGEDLPALRCLISGGEACTPEIVARHAPGRRFVNAYGPTEITVAATYHHVPDTSYQEPVVSIGKPLTNTRVFLLDRYLRPVPIGASGEIYIAGAGLARGYLNRAALTAERFVPDPFAQEPGARMYRSGDLARFRADGSIEFLGRADQQVKVRGFRIEPGEIEAALEKHAGIRQAAVTVRTDKNGNKKLIAFIVPSEKAGSRSRSWAGELRNHLRDFLPDYMLPAQIEPLDALPLTPSGKIDYRALPLTEAEPAAAAGSGGDARTPAEAELSRIWCEVLGRTKVGINDNFFELGGDSILSIQIVARANQRGLALTPKHLFQHQTIAELAAAAGTEAAIAAEQAAVAGTAPLTPVQHWFFEQNLAEAHHWNQAAMLEAPVSVSPERIGEVVRALLAHHDVLRARFRADGAEIPAAGDTPFSVVDLSQTPAGARAAAMEAAAAEIQASLNLEHGPVVRVALLNLGPDTASRILIAIHHLVVDAVSWRILLEDFNTAFEQLQADRPVQLPAKTTSFLRWAEKLNEYAKSAQAAGEVDYWLSGERQTAAPLPVDYPEGRQVNTREMAKSFQLELSVEETNELLHQVSKTYHTEMPEVLLATLAQAGAQWGGMKSMLVDVEGHGREPLFTDVDLARTVGWFTTIYPVHLSMPVSVSFRPGTALKSVKEQLRRIPGRGIGYGLLRYLGADPAVRKALAELPQPEIGFNYLGHVDAGQAPAAAFRPATESCGPVMSPRGARRHLLEIVASISGGRLLITWTYNEEVHRRSTVDDLARAHVRMLRLVIAHSKSAGSETRTPSDFPLAALDERMMNRLSQQLA